VLSRLEHWAQVLAWGAAAALAAAAAVTVADIVLRGAGRAASFLTGEPLGLGLVGVVDLVQLCVVTAAWLAIPWAFATGGHVAVDLLHERLPPAAREASAVVAAAAACVFLVFVLRYCVEQAQTVATYGDRSATLQIPLLWYWLPLLFGLALSVLITAGQTVVRTGRLLRALGRP
jgi:TRAP-type C4-dicarboxylate transport system permease small subunit